ESSNSQAWMLFNYQTAAHLHVLTGCTVIASNQRSGGVRDGVKAVSMAFSFNA
ncbi:hypothetical protein K5T82_004969, partial [Salmonella enterica]|nr:hypothetical protein [Salmonella enterica]